MSVMENSPETSELVSQAISLLKELIATPSLSREEDQTASIIFRYLENKGLEVQSRHHNIWVKSTDFNQDWPTILLNSHHDTVKPVSTWQRDPYEPLVEEGKLFGLGSNDAGASLVALMHVFLHFDRIENRGFNLLFLASAEEEVSGKNGVESVLPELGDIDLGIVGEPTSMNMAIAEKGLMVIDGMAQGVSGHAARKEGVNAIYIALQDIQWIKDFHFPDRSEMLGEVNMNVTQINAGTQHNVVPDQCSFVVDVRTNECYSNQQVFEIIDRNTNSTMTPRSFRLNSSNIPQNHPLVKRGLEMGRTMYGSPTLSDQALMNGFPTIKIGPGKTERSHTADEFIYLDELKEGIQIYIDLLTDLTIEKIETLG